MRAPTPGFGQIEPLTEDEETTSGTRSARLDRQGAGRDDACRGRPAR